MNEDRISVEELQQTIDANYIQEVETVWHGIRKIKIKKHLSLDESLNFVESTVSACFAEDTGEYLPEIKDFMIRCALLSTYANFNLPEDLDERFDLVYSTELVHTVAEHVDHGHFDAMLKAIDDKIAMRANSNAAALTKQVEDVVAGFEDLEQSLSDMFGGIDSDTIMQIAGALSSGGFDEDRLVSAVIASNAKKEGEG